MEVTFDLIKLLREKTGAGIMDCKKALIGAESFDNAIEYLEQNGKHIKSFKKDANEGIVHVCIGDKKAVIIEVNCETDFAARSIEFRSCVSLIAQKALELIKIEFDNFAKKILLQTSSIIGEKVQIKRMEILEGGDYGSYVHMGSQVGVVVQFKSSLGWCVDEEVGKNIAMHIVAFNPKYLDSSEITNSKDALLEDCLLEQKYLKDQTQTVLEYLNQKDIKIERFVRYQVK